MTRVNIENNIASSGGGLYAENSTKIIGFYTSISNNFAITDSLYRHLQKSFAISQYGGGIYAVNSDIRLHNALIDHNIANNK